MRKLSFLILNLCLMLSIMNHGYACDENHEHKEDIPLVSEANMNNQIFSESNRQLDTRLRVYNKVAPHLKSLTDSCLLDLLEKATSIHSGICGKGVSLELEGICIFAKKIPLTDIEKQPENIQSTANLFGLPPYYQYGIGSAGFNVWRELSAHTMTVNWR